MQLALGGHAWPPPHAGASMQHVEGPSRSAAGFLYSQRFLDPVPSYADHTQDTHAQYFTRRIT
jgi:hypothetical protein